MKILIVDDNSLFLILFQVYAKDITHFEFIYKNSGKEALESIEKANKEEISLLVSDIRMPEMSGIELSQIVNDKYPHIPIILITGMELDYFQKNDLISSAKLLSKDIGVEGILEEIKLFFEKNSK
jgi:CheY-like chemotaxis protein